MKSDEKDDFRWYFVTIVYLIFSVSLVYQVSLFFFLFQKLNPVETDIFEKLQNLMHQNLWDARIEAIG